MSVNDEVQEHVSTPPAKRNIGKQTGNQTDSDRQTQGQSAGLRQGQTDSGSGGVRKHLRNQDQPYSDADPDQPDLDQRSPQKVTGKLDAKKAANAAVIQPQLKSIPIRPLKLTRGQELPRRKEQPQIVGSKDGLKTAIM